MKMNFLTRLIGVVSLWALMAFASWAQSNNDAYHLTNETFSGSARYQAMGGAFGALGGDFSSLKQNPAGMALLKRNDVQFTAGLMGQSSISDWNELSTLVGIKRAQKGSSLNSFSVTLGGFSDKLRCGGSFTFGISPRHTFSRNISAYSGKPLEFSLADFAASITPEGLTPGQLNPDKNKQDVYKTVAAPWLSILGHQGGWTVPHPDGYYLSTFEYGGKLYGPREASLSLKERGATTDYIFNGGFNWDDLFYLGFGLTTTTIDYFLSSSYKENFPEKDFLYLDNLLHTVGLGTSLSVGAIIRPVDFLRLGVSYYSPTWMRLKDNFSAEAGSRYSQAVDEHGNPYPEEAWFMNAKTPEATAPQYSLTGPSKAVFSAAAIFGGYGLLSADLELTNHQNISFDDTPDFRYSNNILRKYYKKNTLGFRLGAEIRPLQRLSLRGGFNYRESPIQGELQPKFDSHAVVPISEAGTVPHYDLEGAYFNYTMGVGIRVSPAFYMDFALVFGTRNYAVYAFPTYTIKDGAGKTHILNKSPEPIKVKENQINAALTFGYRF